MGLSVNAKHYVIAHILRVALPAMVDQFTIHAKSSSASYGEITVYFSLCSDSDTERLFNGTYPMQWVDSFDGSTSIPVMLSPGVPFSNKSGKVLTINADIITMPFILMSRYEQLRISKRDKHGRFLYKDSLSCKYGIIDFPLIDEYAMLFKNSIESLLCKGDCSKRKGLFILTCDIDGVRRFSSLVKSIKTIIMGDIIRRRDIRLGIKSLRQYLRCFKSPELDPEFLGIKELMQTSVRYNFKSEFYFLGYSRHDRDYRYTVNSPSVVGLMRYLTENKMIVGFHGGFESSDNIGVFLEQKSRVEEAFGYEITRGRQHYLCFDERVTPGIWESAGIKDDFTLGFCDREGYMCGTCHPFPVFNLQLNKPTSVIEHPLIVMDGTLYGNQGYTIEQAYDVILRLYEKTCSVGGDFVMLWHNNNIYRDMENWYKDVYLKFVEHLSK